MPRLRFKQAVFWKIGENGDFLWWIVVRLVDVWLLWVWWRVAYAMLCYEMYLMGIWYLRHIKTYVVSSSLLILVFLLSLNHNCTTHSCLKHPTLANMFQNIPVLRMKYSYSCSTPLKMKIPDESCQTCTQFETIDVSLAVLRSKLKYSGF